MGITHFYKKLSAPLVNQLWSWGSVRQADGVVFLGVWQDRSFAEKGVAVMQVTHHAKYAEDKGNRGYQERTRHVELIRAGAACYMIMCKVIDPDAIPRKIETFNEKDLFVGGELLEKDGEIFIKVAKRMPYREAMLLSPAAS